MCVLEYCGLGSTAQGKAVEARRSAIPIAFCYIILLSSLKLGFFLSPLFFFSFFYYYYYPSPSLKKSTVSYHTGTLDLPWFRQPLGWVSFRWAGP